MNDSCSLGNNLVQLLICQFSGKLDSINSAFLCGNNNYNGTHSRNYRRDGLQSEYLSTPMGFRTEEHQEEHDILKLNQRKSGSNSKIGVGITQISNQSCKNSSKICPPDNKQELELSSEESIFEREYEEKLDIPKPNFRKYSDTTITINKLTTLTKPKSIDKKRCIRTKPRSSLALNSFKSKSKLNYVKKTLTLLKMNLARRLGATPEMMQRIDKEPPLLARPEKAKIRRCNSFMDYNEAKSNKDLGVNSSQEITAKKCRHKFPHIGRKGAKLKILKNQKTVKFGKQSQNYSGLDNTPTFPPDHKKEKNSVPQKRDSNPQAAPRTSLPNNPQLKRRSDDSLRTQIISRPSISTSKKLLLKHKRSRIIQLRKSLKSLTPKSPSQAPNPP
ncbi:unnamed protein product [Moneuplotes crassus]|uniref:Uncharacterized protein n=1 Tax=Euplotes crassus TaxID=5936 RepID=A0AAD1X4Z6_EUPCR|nr:unnamed protein product [Moneuplotes crassus]